MLKAGDHYELFLSYFVCSIVAAVLTELGYFYRSDFLQPRLRTPSAGYFFFRKNKGNYLFQSPPPTPKQDY